jgi:hypothetical protein
MDILVGLIGMVCAIIGFVIMCISVGHTDLMTKGGLITFLIGGLIFTWAQAANYSHNKKPENIKVTYHEILEKYNTPYYFNEFKSPTELTGESKFADPKTTHVKITHRSGGWTYWMYVTESRFVELEKKEAEKTVCP